MYSHGDANGNSYSNCDANEHAYCDCNRYNASTQQPMTADLKNNVFTGSAYGPTLPAA